MSRTFVQVGATRDGLDSYLDAARSRGMSAVLVDTAAFLGWRRDLGRRPYDREVPVARPDDPAFVADALRDVGVRPDLVLPGFETTAGGAVVLARMLGVRPWPIVGSEFVVPTKADLRELLSRTDPAIRQPRYRRHGDATERGAGRAPEMSFPQVVKAIDSGGGIGVILVEDGDQRDEALRLIHDTTNFGGGEFAGVMVEEFVTGAEYSLQGMAIGGCARVLAVCAKITSVERLGSTDLRRFWELGHICSPGHLCPAAMVELAQRCVAATGYENGPFCIDLIVDDVGVHPLEMGFRLSGGGLVALIERVTGIRWNDLVFSVLLGETLPQPAAEPGPDTTVGQIYLRTAEEFRAAEKLSADDRSAGVTRFPQPSADLEIGGDLMADRTYYSSFAGRLTVSGKTPDEVREKLESCLHGQRGMSTKREVGNHHAGRLEHGGADTRHA